jgi:hypothetical protein
MLRTWRYGGPFTLVPTTNHLLALTTLMSELLGGKVLSTQHESDAGSGVSVGARDRGSAANEQYLQFVGGDKFVETGREDSSGAESGCQTGACDWLG